MLLKAQQLDLDTPTNDSSTAISLAAKNGQTYVHIHSGRGIVGSRNFGIQFFNREVLNALLSSTEALLIAIPFGKYSQESRIGRPYTSVFF